MLTKLYSGTDFIREYIITFPLMTKVTSLHVIFDEIRFIVNEMFKPKRITNIKVYKRDEEITCTIYTEWETTDDEGNEEIVMLPDEITLRNPFDYGEKGIQANFGLNNNDYTKLKQFCYAKGIYGQSIEWLINNPYMISDKNVKKVTC